LTVPNVLAFKNYGYAIFLYWNSLKCLSSLKIMAMQSFYIGIASNVLAL